MSRKSIINRNKILNQIVNDSLTLSGDPLIYSIKYPIGKRELPPQFFRNKRWYSFVRCQFPSYMSSSTPIVIIARFYVKPPGHVYISKKLLRAEKTPAAMSFELCDYGLAFLEHLFDALFRSYRQIVKLDMEKYYSDNPRIVFKFMKWEHYVKLQNNDPIYPETKMFSPSQQKKQGLVQSRQPRDAYYTRIRNDPRQYRKAAKRSAASGCAFSPTDTSQLQGTEAPASTPTSTCETP